MARFVSIGRTFFSVSRVIWIIFTYTRPTHATIPIGKDPEKYLNNDTLIQK